MPIIQNEQGTLVFSDAPQNSVSQILPLKQAGIDRFRIDGLFYEDETVLEWIKAYSALLEGKTADIKEGDDTWYHQVSLTRKEDGHGQN
jgi:collagenase-like PrtC family protease